ncbi:MAG: Bis(5'-nucleosyl)-tetraphosphatase [Parcubacteria group bacterium Licking1014_1]|nr:MAG: Bis(5'-nucleosyl)-tetraphosphatase [Parcubacteria group bacterium Licking1014_1]
MPREKSIGAIIFRKEKGVIYYLILHYHSGHWEFARGHGEEGESEITTAKREIEEETGLRNLRIILGFREYSKFFFRRTYGLSEKEKKKAPWVFKLVVLYLAETKIDDVKISGEHKGYAWMPYEEAHKKLAKNAKGILEKADKFLLKK